MPNAEGHPPAQVDPVAELRSAVTRLERRVERLESGPGPGRERDGEIVERLLADLRGDGTGPGEATVVYAGAGPWDAGTVAWQLGRSWSEVLAGAGEHTARVLSALANGTRLRIVAELLSGPLPTGALATRLDQPSTGQLFHHLKELLTAGLVHQPERGVYAVDRRHVVPLLVVLSAASDLAGPFEPGPSSDAVGPAGDPR